MKTLLRAVYTAPFLLQTDPRPSKPPVTPAILTFKVPESGLHATPWPRPQWPTAMRIAVEQQFQCKACKQVSAEHVNLGALGQGALLTRQSECGQGRNCFDFAVLYRVSGQYRTADAPGIAWVMAVPGSLSMLDIIGGQDEPCCSATVERISFRNGSWSKSGCDNVTFEGNFGDFKHVTIVPC